MAQEENVDHFHTRTTEIQSLLQSSEPPLELQVSSSGFLFRLVLRIYTQDVCGFIMAELNSA